MQHYENLIEKKFGFVCLDFGLRTSTCKRISKCKSLYIHSTKSMYAKLSIQMLLKVQFVTRGCKSVAKSVGLNLNAHVREILSKA